MNDVIEDAFYLDDYVKILGSWMYTEFEGYVGKIVQFLPGRVALVETGMLSTIYTHYDGRQEVISSSMWYIPLEHLDRFESKDAMQDYLKERALNIFVERKDHGKDD